MSINIENINKAIAVMERVQENEINLNKTLLGMGSWQYNEIHLTAFATEEEVLHACGTTCCFAGWIAVSPEFQEMGVYPSPDSGQPHLRKNRYEEVEAILSRLFGVPVEEVADLIYTASAYSDVETVDDVLAVLEKWKEGEFSNEA